MELDQFNGSDGSSPHSGEYLSDSASSSSADHSSPSEYTSPQGLIYDVGGIMVQPWPTATIDPTFPAYQYGSHLGPSALSPAKAGSDEFEHTISNPSHHQNGSLTLPADFWQQPTDAHSHDAELGLGGLAGLEQGAPGGGYGSYEHSMFDDLIHDSQCALVTFSSHLARFPGETSVGAGVFGGFMC